MVNKKKSIFLDFSLLKSNRHFRNIFIARTISILGLGMLSVALPVQVYSLTNDTLHVAIVMTLEGIGLFIGLLLGGVLADIYERKKLILFARSTCGIGFAAMTINAWLPDPSLNVIYILSIWDGFFGALGITALMACMTSIVGRENLMQARAITMVSVRLATVISPAIGGVIIAISDVAWNYMIATIGTGFTVITLLTLPIMPPKKTSTVNGLNSLWTAFSYILKNKVIVSVVAVGTLVTLSSSIKVVFPALAATLYGGSDWMVGLMYSAISLGSTLGALVSGWTIHLKKPGTVIIFTSLCAFICLMGLGSSIYLSSTLLLLVAFGYCVSITALLQYSFVQGHTPDHYLGRINGIWSAENAAADSVGTISMGALAKFFSPLVSIFSFGLIGFGVGLVMLVSFQTLRKSPLVAPDIETTS